MAAHIDKEVLLGFIEEAKSYLPVIRQGLATFQADSTRVEALEEAHRHAHTIKGAASMVGLAGLSHIAYFVEETLEAIGAGQLDMNEETVAWLGQTLIYIEVYLENILDGSVEERPLLIEVTQSYRRLRGLPAEEDEAALATVLARIVERPAATVPDEPDEPDEVFDDELSPELLEAFYMEAEDHLRNIHLALASLNKDPDQQDLLQVVRRGVHTLKGAAATVGLSAMAELTHRMEDVLDLLYDGYMAFDSDIMALLFSSSDTLEDMLKDDADSEAIQQLLHDLYAGYDILLSEDVVGQKLKLSTGVVADEETGLLTEAAAQTGDDALAESDVPAPAPRIKGKPARTETGEVVRVPIERLDDLIRLVSELVITRTAFEQRIGDLMHEVEELRPSIDRLRRISAKLEIDYEVSTLGGGAGHLMLAPAGRSADQNGGAALAAESAFLSPPQTQDFDELELDRYTEFHLLSRELSETTLDVFSVGNALNTLAGDFDGILNRQSRLSSELQEKLMRARMVPLSTLTSRLHRTARVVAHKQNKLVDLVIKGEQIDLDKTVLEEIADPLLHILRNAVDHGIEPPALRQVLGKPEQGLIVVHGYYEGNQVVIEINDDGAGLEPDRIRSHAVSGGYISEAEAARLSDEELWGMVFMPGFSTASEISDISGRGVGLDVVKANINKLQGTVTLDSRSGEGTTFTIRLPMTLAVTRALLVKAHRETFAIPLNAVGQILRLEREAVSEVGHEPIIRVGQKIYPLLRLGEILRLSQPSDETVERLPVLIVNVGGREVALIVDQIIQGREIVIKSLGTHLRRVEGIMGATLMGDGSVVLILNPADLLKDPARSGMGTRPPILRPQTPPEAWNIMVVDDSVSVRRVVSNLVKNAGWQPITAKDGLEALEMIQTSTRSPDLILLDIEMPRMDGYELAAALRSQAAYRDLPIVMLTSRAGEKHRQKAFDVGASEYVVKPYQDELLLNIIHRLVHAARETTGG
jgi:chemosensory pili system protein ChpA (sensor histidine kinase/response regulator)